MERERGLQWVSWGEVGHARRDAIMTTALSIVLPSIEIRYIPSHLPSRRRSSTLPSPTSPGVYDSGHPFAGQVKHPRSRSKPPSCPSALSGQGAEEGLGRMKTMRRTTLEPSSGSFLVIRRIRHARLPARAGAESTIALRQQVFRAKRRAEPRPLSRMNVLVVSTEDTALTR